MAFKLLQKCNHIPLAQGNCKRLDHNLNLWLFMYDTEAMLAAERQKNEKLKKSNHRYTMNPLQRMPLKSETVQEKLADPFEKFNLESREKPHTTTIHEKLDHLGRTLEYLTTDKYKRISPEMLEMLDSAKKPKYLNFKWLQPAEVIADDLTAKMNANGTMGDDDSIYMGWYDSVAGEGNYGGTGDATGNNTGDVKGDGTVGDSKVDTVGSLPSSLAKHLHEVMKTTAHTNNFYGINFYESTTGKNVADKNVVDYLDPNALGVILTKLKDSEMIKDKELEHLVKFLGTALHADSEMVGQLLELLKARGLLSHDIINYLRKLLEHSVNNEAFAGMMQRLDDVFEVFKESDRLNKDPYRAFGESAKFFPAKEKKVKKPKQHERGIVFGKGKNKSKKKGTTISNESMRAGKHRSVYKIGSTFKSQLKQGQSKAGGVYFIDEKFPNKNEIGNENENENEDENENELQTFQYDSRGNIRGVFDGRGDQMNRMRKSDSQKLNDYRSFIPQYEKFERDDGKFKLGVEGLQVGMDGIEAKKKNFWYALDLKELLNFDEHGPMAEFSFIEPEQPGTNKSEQFLERSKVSRLTRPNRSQHAIPNIEQYQPPKEFYGYLVQGGFFKPWPISIDFKNKQKFFRLSTARRSSYGKELVSIRGLKNERNIHAKAAPLKSDARDVRAPKPDVIPSFYYLKNYSNKNAPAKIKSDNKVQPSTFLYK